VSTVDIDGDGVDDLKLTSSWSKQRFTFKSTKKTTVENLTDQDISFDWPVGGKTGTVKAGKTVTTTWTSYTAQTTMTGDIAAKKGAATTTQKTSAFNCLTDFLKDMTPTIDALASVNIPGSFNPPTAVVSTYGVDGSEVLTMTSDYVDNGDGTVLYTYEMQNHTLSPIGIDWRAARNLDNPTGQQLLLDPATTLTIDYLGTALPDVYGNFMTVVDNLGNVMEVHAPAFVPGNESGVLVGLDVPNFLYNEQFEIENWELYPDNLALQSQWLPTGLAQPPVLEVDFDGPGPDSNTNNEPPLVGLGSGQISFESQQAVALNIAGNQGGLTRAGLGLAGSDGVVAWVMLPNADTEVLMIINGVAALEPQLPGNGSEDGGDPFALPQVGGYIGVHFDASDFPIWDGTIDTIELQFNSPSGPQTVFIDQIVSLFSPPDGNVAGGIPGDLDGDGFVGITDLNIVLGNWNQTIPPGDPLADPSGDNFVGIEDLNEVLGNWNAGTPPGAHANIPEPASLGLLLAGSVMLLRRAG
jgi:hypothetical protein